MPMTVRDLVENINLVVNKGLGNLVAGADARYLHTAADIATALTNAATQVTALSGVSHSREITDPGPALNPSQP
jgi:hypothetical protein